MMNYKSVEDRLVLSPRMENVRKGILQRLKPYQCREDTATSPVNAGGKDPFGDVFSEMKDEPYVICLANGIVRSWMETPFIIFPHEAIVGITRPQYPLMEHFSWGIRFYESVLEEPEFTNKDALRERDRAMSERWQPKGFIHMYQRGIDLMGKERYDTMSGDGLMWTGGYQGHTVPNYDTLLKNGLDGMLQKIDSLSAGAKDEKSANLYRACRIIIEGMSAWLEKYSETAASLAERESDPIQRGYYKAIAENCAFVSHHKPVTLYHAVQLMWCLSLWDWVDCVGRMDQYLLPFYEYSLKHGDAVSVEDAVVSITFKLWENGSHNITVGGVTDTDHDATSDLTYLLLQIIRNIHDTHPRISLRVHENMPAELLELAVQLWSEGMSDPSVVSDKTVVSGLVKMGIPPEDAKGYTMLGCQEIEIPGKSNFGCEDGSLNLARVLEYTMRNGRSRKFGIQIGPETGEFEDFETFEDFWNAYETQVKYFTKIFCDLCDRGQEIREANYSKLVKTPFTDGCLEKGQNHDMGGPIYNYGVVETAGVAVVADSMSAIKKLVFDEQKISKKHLMEILDADFCGYEAERQMLLNSAPKFGNDNDEADAMAVRVLDQFWSEIAKYKSVRGDAYTGACSLLQGGITYGAGTGAMPDGRFEGEPLGNSIGPRPGADHSGVSAMLASVAKLPLEKGMGGTTLNVVLTTKLLSNPALRKTIGATIKSYLMNGGQMAQITTANLDDLLDAKEHPERHGDLIIRIGGFSIQFVQLDKAAQNEVISRYDGSVAV